MAIETKLEKVLEVLQEIKEILKEQKQQTQTKITVVGNKTQTTKGLQSSEDFTL